MITVPWAREVELYQRSSKLMSWPCAGRRRAACPTRRSAALGPRGRPDGPGPGIDYTQYWYHSASRCWTGTRLPRTLYQGRSPSSSSPCLTAAGKETPDACLAPARACWATGSLPISPWNPSSLARGVARGGSCSWERDSERQPGSYLGQLSRPYSLNLISESPGPDRQAVPGLRAGTQWKLESLFTECQSQGNDGIWETLFWFVRHLVLIPIFPPTIPIYDRSVEFFVDSYHDFYSDLILVVQVPAGKKILGKYLEA